MLTCVLLDLSGCERSRVGTVVLLHAHVYVCLVGCIKRIGSQVPMCVCNAAHVSLSECKDDDQSSPHMHPTPAPTNSSSSAAATPRPCPATCRPPPAPSPGATGSWTVSGTHSAYTVLLEYRRACFAVCVLIDLRATTSYTYVYITTFRLYSHRHSLLFSRCLYLPPAHTLSPSGISTHPFSHRPHLSIP